VATILVHTTNRQLKDQVLLLLLLCIQFGLDSTRGKYMYTVPIIGCTSSSLLTVPLSTFFCNFVFGTVGKIKEKACNASFAFSAPLIMFSTLDKKISYSDILHSFGAVVINTNTVRFRDDEDSYSVAQSAAAHPSVNARSEAGSTAEGAKQGSENMRWRVHAYNAHSDSQQQDDGKGAPAAATNGAAATSTTFSATTATTGTLAEIQTAIALASSSSAPSNGKGGPALIWVDLLPALTSGLQREEEGQSLDEVYSCVLLFSLAVRRKFTFTGNETFEKKICPFLSFFTPFTFPVNIPSLLATPMKVGNICLQLWRALPQGGILTCATQAPLEPLRALSARKQAAKWNARSVAEKRHVAVGVMFIKEKQKCLCMAIYMSYQRRRKPDFFC